MTTIEFLNSPVARALGWTLLHAVWQGFALVLPTAVLLYLLRRGSSNVRYRLGVVVLLTQLLISIATFAWYYQPTTATTQSVATALTTLTIRLSGSAPSLSWSQQVLLFLDTHLSQFVCLYLVGLTLLGLRLAGGWLQLHQLRRSAIAAPLTTERALVERLRTALGIRVRVLVHESAHVAGPLIIGVLTPMLLLPVGLATGLSNRELEAVFAHELAHVKRYDYAINLLQSVVEVLYFFHPALWWLSARVREEREHCCDDLAVQLCGDNGRALAKALARIEERRLEQTSTPTLAMAFAGRRQLLLHRVQRVLGLSTRSLVSNRSLAGLTLATLLLISASVYAVQQPEKPQQPKPRTTASRRTAPDRTTELHFDSNRKLTYVVWKGQKLSASRVDALQKQWEQVMSGRVNLDDVAQPDHDILLNAIESQYGKISSSEQEKYESIAEAALQTIPLSPDGTVEGLAKVNYDSIIQKAFSSLRTAKASVDSLIEPDGMTFRRNYDSIVERQAMNREQADLLKLQSQKLRFSVEAAERSIERLERQKSVVEQRRFSQTMRQQLLIGQSGVTQTDSAQAAINKQIEAGEATIQKTESDIEAANRQIINAQGELEKAQKPLRDIESQIRRLHSADGWGTSISKAGWSSATTKTEWDTPATKTVGTGHKQATSIHRIIEGDVVIPAPPAPPAMAVPAKPARPTTPPRAVKGRATIPAQPARPKE